MELFDHEYFLIQRQESTTSSNWGAQFGGAQMSAVPETGAAPPPALPPGPPPQATSSSEAIFEVQK